MENNSKTTQNAQLFSFSKPFGALFSEPVAAVGPEALQAVRSQVAEEERDVQVVVAQEVVFCQGEPTCKTQQLTKSFS